MLQESFEEMITDIESLEFAGTPRHLAFNEIAGIVTLPLMDKLRAARAGRHPACSTDEASQLNIGGPLYSLTDHRSLIRIAAERAMLDVVECVSCVGRNMQWALRMPNMST
jgi:hypothetical protein